MWECKYNWNSDLLRGFLTTQNLENLEKSWCWLREKTWKPEKLKENLQNSYLRIVCFHTFSSRTYCYCLCYFHVCSIVYHQISFSLSLNIFIIHLFFAAIKIFASKKSWKTVGILFANGLLLLGPCLFPRVFWTPNAPLCETNKKSFPIGEKWVWKVSGRHSATLGAFLLSVYCFYFFALFEYFQYFHIQHSGKYS